jgi:hypothetical protein
MGHRLTRIAIGFLPGEPNRLIRKLGFREAFLASTAAEVGPGLRPAVIGVDATAAAYLKKRSAEATRLY